MTNNGSNWNAIMQYSFLHVFARVDPQTVDPAVWDEIQRFKAQFGIC